MHCDTFSALEPLSREPLLSEFGISWDIITSMNSVLCPSDPTCRSCGSVCAHSSDRCDLLSDILLQARTYASLYLRKVLETSQGWGRGGEKTRNAKNSQPSSSWIQIRQALLPPRTSKHVRRCMFVVLHRGHCRSPQVLILSHCTETETVRLQRASLSEAQTSIPHTAYQMSPCTRHPSKTCQSLSHASRKDAPNYQSSPSAFLGI